MPIAIGCTGCGKQGFVPDFAAGRLIRCFVCSTQMIAPSAQGSPLRTVRLGAAPKASASSVGNGTGASRGPNAGGDRHGPGAASDAGRMTRSSRILKDDASSNADEARTKVDPHGLNSRQSASVSPASSGRGQTDWGNGRESSILPGWSTVELPLADVARAEAQVYGASGLDADLRSVNEPGIVRWQPPKPKSPELKRLAIIACITAALALVASGVWLALVVYGVGPADQGAAASVATADPSPASPPGPVSTPTPTPVNGSSFPGPLSASTSGFGTPNGVARPEPQTPVWNLQPDPLPSSQPVAAPEAVVSSETAIPLPGLRVDREPAVFADSASSFAAIGENYDGQCDRQVFELLTGKATGRVHYSRELTRLALSPDGRWLAGASARSPIAAVVLDTQKNREVIEAPMEREPIFLGFGLGDRLVAADASGRIAVHDRASGRLIAQTTDPAGIRRDSAIFSPGRRYLAYVTFDGGALKAVDLSSESLVLAIRQPVVGSSAYEGVAFSRKGNAVSALSRISRGDYRLQTWSLKGVAESEHQIGADAIPARPASSWMSSALQWAPDDSGWLVFSQAIIERQSGQIVWRMPFDSSAPESPRQFFGWERIARFEGSNNPVLKIAALPKAEIAVALKAAAQGGEAIDAHLPALRTPNIDSVQVRKSETRTLWRATAEPAAKAWAPSEAVKSWELSPDAAPERVFFTALKEGVDPQVIIVHQPNGGNRLIERIKLADGSRTARFPLAQELTPIAVSPNGEILATASASGRPRVDLHQIADGKYVVGWRPAQSGQEYRGGIPFASFLDETQLLLVHQSGAVSLWSAREAKAIYRLDNAIAGRSRFALSAGRTTLACWNGAELRMIDAATGAIRGVAKVGGDANLGSDSLGIAFHPNGAELAVAVGGQVAIVDINKGEAKTRISANLPAIRKIEFMGDSFVLLNNEALHRTRGTRELVWRFSGAAFHADEAWGGRHWLVSPSAPLRLASVVVPSPEIIQTLALASDPQTHPLIQRGQKLALAIEGLETLDAEEGRQYLRRQIAAGLEKVGCTLDDASSVRLTIRFREERTGRTRFYAPIRSDPGLDVRGQLASVLTKASEYKVSFDIAIDDGRQPSYTVVKDFALNSLADQFRIDPAGPGQDAVRREAWLAAVRKAAEANLPPYLVRQGERFLTLPGATSWGELLP